MPREIRNSEHGTQATACRRAVGAAVCIVALLLCFAVGVWAPPAPVRWAGMAVAMAGLLCALWATRTLGSARLTGRSRRPPYLVLRGPYRLVRHPFYLGGLLLLFGLLLITGDQIAGLVLACALLVAGTAIPFEERRLTRDLGEAYRRYRNAVPALLPCSVHRWNVGSAP